MYARSLALLILATTICHAGEPSKIDPAQAKALVEKKLSDLKGPQPGIRIVDEKYLRDIFPKHSFVAVHYRQWPVAIQPPEPMMSQNVFAVSADGKLNHLADAKKLEEFFKSTLREKLNRDKTVKSWLRLRMEYIHDGFYKFKYPDDTEVSLSGVEQAGTAAVVPEGGNSGSLRAVLLFDRDKGSLVAISEVNKVMQGIRPRCQATLLLHPERLIREIAEQDLLVMGRSARGYLMEQRAKASDELRREIDRVWRRIEAEGR